MAIKISFGSTRSNSRISSLAGGVICLLLSAFGFYVVFFGSEISGGIPLLPDALNTLFGRIIFGLGALFTGGLSVYAFMEFFRNKSSN